MANLEIYQFPCRSDNYGVLIHDAENNLTASIDAPETAAVKQALATKGWTLTHILTTHYHADHTDGNLDLKEETGCTIVGPRNEADRVRGIDVKVGDGDAYEFGAFAAKVFDTPGPHGGSHHLLVPYGQFVLCRRYAVYAGLRPVVRGRCENHVEHRSPRSRRCRPRRSFIRGMNIRRPMPSSR